MAKPFKILGTCWIAAILTFGAFIFLTAPHTASAKDQGKATPAAAAKPPTKLPSKTKLQMGLSAKPAPPEVRTRIQPAKARPPAQWGKAAPAATGKVGLKNPPPATTAKSAGPKMPASKAAAAPKAVAPKAVAPKAATPKITAPKATVTKTAAPKAAPLNATPSKAAPSKQPATKMDAPPAAKSTLHKNKLPKPNAEPIPPAETSPKIDPSSVPDFSKVIGAGFAKFLFVGLGLILLLSIINIIAYQKLYKLAGYSAWHVWIPIYNLVIHLKIANLPAWAILGYLVPYAGTLMPMFTSYRFAKAYGKSHQYCLLFAVFNPIMTAHLAFSSSTVYTGHNPGGPGPAPGFQDGQTMGKSMAQSLMQRGAGSAALQGTNGAMTAPPVSRFNRQA